MCSGEKRGEWGIAWTRQEVSGTVVYRSDLLNFPWMDHGFSTRIGGRSSGVYSGLNLGLLCGDDPDVVAGNRRLFFAACGVEPERVFTVRQVHGEKVLVVDQPASSAHAFEETTLLEADALVTACPGTALATTHADCVPVILVDPINRLVAAVHAGWRGTFHGIVREALLVMEERFNTEAERLLAAIGPAIGGCCYTVSPELHEEFQSRYTGLDSLSADQDLERKPTLNLPEMNKELLIKYGVLPERIDVCALCTSCHPQDFFSYRRDQGETGRHLSLVFLK